MIKDISIIKRNNRWSNIMYKDKLIDLNYIRLYIKILCSFELKSKQLKKRGINADLWKRKFINLLKSKDVRCEELLSEFLTCQMKKISHHNIRRKNKYAPILFCVIRNDIYKIKVFMEHYRQLGVEAFIFLDNNSGDGTKEFLCQQEDVILYTSDQQYSSARRVAWINRLLAIYGQDRWCLVVDSDELVTYVDCEKHKISDMVRKAVQNNYYRVEGFMMDMYSKENLFKGNYDDNYVCNFKWFDTLSYNLNVEKNEVVITGGPRKRVFQIEMLLSKYPLFYYRDDDFVASAHYMIPVEPIRKCPIWIALCHYKFMNDSDLLKIKEAVHNENYAGGSIFYKQYLSTVEENSEINFYEEGNSCEMKRSDCLKNISFLRAPFADKK